jgi:vacuolar-type H+-ATPase subunit H
MSKDALDKIEQLVIEAKDDNTKFWDNENSSAGSRLRKFWQELRKIGGEERKAIQEKKNSSKKPKAAKAAKATK